MAVSSSRLPRSWRSAVSGLTGAGPADMDFVALKEGAARDIALAFGVPPVPLPFRQNLFDRQLVSIDIVYRQHWHNSLVGGKTRA